MLNENLNLLILAELVELLVWTSHYQTKGKSVHIGCNSSAMIRPIGKTQVIERTGYALWTYFILMSNGKYRRQKNANPHRKEVKYIIGI